MANAFENTELTDDLLAGVGPDATATFDASGVTPAASSERLYAATTKTRMRTTLTRMRTTKISKMRMTNI